MRECIVSVSSCLENCRIRDSGTGECHPVVVYDSSMVLVNLEAREFALVARGVVSSLIAVVHGVTIAVARQEFHFPFLCVKLAVCAVLNIRKRPLLGFFSDHARFEEIGILNVTLRVTAIPTV